MGGLVQAKPPAQHRLGFIASRRIDLLRQRAPDRSSPQRSDRRHADDGQVGKGVELLAIGLDILDPGVDGLEAGKLVNDQAIGVGRLAEVDPKLLAVAQGDAPTAVALHRPHDLGYDLAVVGLRVVDGGVNDHIGGHARCLLFGVCDAFDHDLIGVLKAMTKAGKCGGAWQDQRLIEVGG
jgi:hypothetical protein